MTENPVNKFLLSFIALLLAFALAQSASRILGQPLPVEGATAVKTFDERVLRAFAVTEGKRCQIFEGWSFKQATQEEYRKLVDGFNEALKKAGWKVEPKGQVAQGESTVEAYKLTGGKGELIIGYWLLAKGASQLYWCRLG
ncbi:MAG: hypothetical protein C4333_06580 [Meiothermus sp.]